LCPAANNEANCQAVCFVCFAFVLLQASSLAPWVVDTAVRKTVRSDGCGFIQAGFLHFCPHGGTRSESVNETWQAFTQNRVPCSPCLRRLSKERTSQPSRVLCAKHHLNTDECLTPIFFVRKLGLFAGVVQFRRTYA